MLKVLRSVLIFTLLITAFNVFSEPAYAVNCTPLSDEAPGPQDIICPVIRIVNIALLSSGAVLILMLLWGGVKLALAIGDPKAMQAASATWTWAIIGFAVVIGGATLLKIVAGWFGWEADFLNPFDTLQQKIQEFMSLLHIEG